jgi:hypothetical protein
MEKNKIRAFRVMRKVCSSHSALAKKKDKGFCYLPAKEKESSSFGYSH